MDTSGLENNARIAYFKYDFSKHGGKVGDIVVYGDGIPANGWIRNASIRVNAAVVGNTSTLAIKAVSSADILAATAESSLTKDAKVQGVPDFATVANSIVLASAINSLTFTVGTADLTAGQVTVVVDWCLSA